MRRQARRGGARAVPRVPGRRRQRELLVVGPADHGALQHDAVGGRVVLAGVELHLAGLAGARAQRLAVRLPRSSPVSALRIPCACRASLALCTWLQVTHASQRPSYSPEGNFQGAHREVRAVAVVQRGRARGHAACGHVRHVVGVVAQHLRVRTRCSAVCKASLTQAGAAVQCSHATLRQGRRLTRRAARARRGRPGRT